MPYCPQCGTQLELNWNACPNCRYDLEKEFESNNQISNDGSYKYEIERVPLNQASPTPMRTYFAKENNTYGTLSLIFGILGLFCIFGNFNFILGVIAIIFGSIGKNKDDNSQMAKIGMTLGIISLLCGIVILIMLLPFIAYFFFPY